MLKKPWFMVKRLRFYSGFSWFKLAARPLGLDYSGSRITNHAFPLPILPLTSGTELKPSSFVLWVRLFVHILHGFDRKTTPYNVQTDYSTAQPS